MKRNTETKDHEPIKNADKKFKQRENEINNFQKFENDNFVGAVEKCPILLSQIFKKK